MKHLIKQLMYWLAIPLGLWIGGFLIGPKLNFQVKCEDINTETYLTCQVSAVGQKYRWSYGEILMRVVEGKREDGTDYRSWQPMTVRRLRSEEDLKQLATRTTHAYAVEGR